MRIEKYFSRARGFDFSIGPSRSFRTWFAIWWARGCDCGVAVGNREIRWTLS